MRLRSGLVALFIAVALTACDERSEESSVPPPQEVTDTAMGHYCGMALVEHAGPKGQIFLKSRKEPIWFSSVRDTLAFTMLPEEPKDIAGIYVNDMSRAKSWDSPGAGTWILAKDAWYVIGSKRKGGMGGDELVPFGSEQAAQDFVAENSGRIAAFTEIPRSAVLGSEEKPPSAAAPAEPLHAH